ncbi:immunity 17 family protein [uncultured Bacteroides sp.]|jgi:small neutral amino acid transporter SnatA (MarC family)|uniref:immunity 17 family protein n=1 Tax=uncultured Bacteroides sp. TaxID=162156 RepID=UPI002595F630|nr:immunity 17 family protein [uncultured Bacteroides sp.]
MIAHYIIQSVFVLVGILSLMASVFNWEWFFTAQNSQFIVRALGRNKSRIFYAILGLSMIAAGIYFFLSVREAYK